MLYVVIIRVISECDEHGETLSTNSIQMHI